MERTATEVADAIADRLGIDPEVVMIDGRSGRISLRVADAERLLDLPTYAPVRSTER